MSLEDIIAAEVEKAEDGVIDTPEPIETDESDTGTDTESTTTEETPEVVDTEEVSLDAEPASKPAKEPATEPEDEIEKILADAGIKPPVEGQRENRIPYSRTRKIIGNALKKDRAKQAETFKTKEAEFEPLKVKATAADNWDRLIATDPERTMQELARIHPALYQKYLEPGKAAPAAPVTSDLGPKPGPDLKYEDGTVGYSPEQFEKREAWLVADATAKAVAAAKSEFDKRLFPFENERKAKETYEAHLSKIKAERNRAEKVYGRLFTDDEAKGEQSEILKAMREHKLSITEASALVLVPKLQGNQTKMRSEIMKELEAKRRGAQKTTPAAVAATSTRHDPNEERSTEDVIREAIIASGLK
jgi:hypothetical protein